MQKCDRCTLKLHGVWMCVFVCCSFWSCMYSWDSWHAGINWATCTFLAGKHFLCCFLSEWRRETEKDSCLRFDVLSLKILMSLWGDEIASRAEPAGASILVFPASCRRIRHLPKFSFFPPSLPPSVSQSVSLSLSLSLCLSLFLVRNFVSPFFFGTNWPCKWFSTPDHWPSYIQRISAEAASRWKWWMFLADICLQWRPCLSSNALAKWNIVHCRAVLIYS